MVHPCGHLQKKLRVSSHARLQIPDSAPVVSDVGLTDVKAPKAAAPPSPPLRGGSLGRSLMGRFASLVRSEEKEGKGGVRLGHDIQLSHIPQRKESRTLLIRRKENCLQ